MLKKITLFIIFTFSSLLSPLTEYEKILYKMEGAAIASSFVVDQASRYILTKSNKLILNTIAWHYKNNHPEATDEEIENYKNYIRQTRSFALLNFIVAALLLPPIKNYADKKLHTRLLFILNSGLDQHFEAAISIAEDHLLFREIAMATTSSFELQVQTMKEFYLKEKRLNYLAQRYNILCNKNFKSNLQNISLDFTAYDLQKPEFVPFPSGAIGVLMSQLIVPYIQKRSFTTIDAANLIVNFTFIVANLYGIDLQKDLNQYYSELFKQLRATLSKKARRSTNLINV